MRYNRTSRFILVANEDDGGTNHGPEVWDSKLLLQTQVEIMKLTNNKIAGNNFSWKVKSKLPRTIMGISGPITVTKNNLLNYQFNDHDDRKEAAMLLADYIIKFRKDNNITDEEITLIGYSHGGNVSTMASQMVYDRTGIKSNLITINTPAYNGKNDPENPLNKSGINDIITFWTPEDQVAGGLAGSDHHKA